MIETTASKRFAEERRHRSHGAEPALSAQKRSPSGMRQNASTERGGYSVFTWLNLVCLDAPLVAISWEWLFARSFDIPVAPGGTAALFLTAWLIYVADRFGDSVSLDLGVPTSLRQRFCLQHRGAWLVAIAAIVILDLLVICGLDSRTAFAGMAVGALALAYLFLNQLVSSVWRRLPLKEISIGFLFAAGVMVPLADGLSSRNWPAWFLFACLCFFNCVSIAVWERDLDAVQRRVSVATIFPAMGGYVLPAVMLFAAASGALCFTATTDWNVSVCIGTSAALLAAVHVCRAAVQTDVRTALADLVLLTPSVMFAVTEFTRTG